MGRFFGYWAKHNDFLRETLEGGSPDEIVQTIFILGCIVGAKAPDGALPHPRNLIHWVNEMQDIYDGYGPWLV
jgi:hypothetical protein